MGCTTLLVLGCDSNPTFENPSDPLSKFFTLPISTPEIVLVNDFDQGAFGRPNHWGWSDSIYYEVNEGRIIRRFTNAEPLLGGKGYALRLDFDVTNNSGSAAGYAELLGDAENVEVGAFNARTMGLKFLSFWIRGENGGEKFEVGIKDDSVETDPKLKSKDIPFEVTTNWRELDIPLDRLTTGSRGARIKLSRITYLTIGFSAGRTGSGKGTVYMDNLSFKWQ
jgi:hypothetical protein